MFDDKLLDLVVECTNIKIEDVGNKYSRERDVKSTNIAEIKAPIGLLYLAGVRKANQINLGK